MKNDRATAIRMISDWLDFDALPSLTLGDYKTVTPFLYELTLGVVRSKGQLDWVVCQLTKSYPKGLLLPVLYVGLYQILFMRQAEHAAVNETVEAAKKLQPRSPIGFYNGVFRNALRQRDALLEKLEKAPLTDRYSHPAFLVQRWCKAFGEEQTIEIMRWNNEIPPLWIRLTAGQDQAAYTQALQRAGIRHKVGHRAPGCWIQLLDSVRVKSLPGYLEGAFYVQDPSTAHAPALLQVQTGETVGDLCASPGGKAQLLAEALGHSGRLVLGDSHEDRLALLQQNISRLGMQVDQVIQADLATEAGVAVVRAAVPKGFDALLLDVPCSNTGVLRRRPEARWQVHTDRFQRLCETQAELLERSAALVKPGGRMVYSTCSIERDENEGQIEPFLQRHPEFKLEESVTLLPGMHRCDGGYAARLRRCGVTSG